MSAATFTQSGGTNSFAYQFYLGYNGGTGNYILSAGNLGGQTEYVGYHGTGNFTQSGGTNANALYLGYGTGSSGTYNLCCAASCPPGAFPSATPARGA